MSNAFSLEQPLTLSSGYRMQWEAAQNAYVLLFAEGLIRLNDSASAILKLCDGLHSANNIISALAEKFPDQDISHDITELLEYAHDQGWISTS